jgi:hypothetical protein
VIKVAPTGTDGTNGSFTQASVPAGTYTALFWNCGANTGGNPDPNYVTIFYGNTYIPRKAGGVQPVRGHPHARRGRAEPEVQPGLVHRVRGQQQRRLHGQRGAHPQSESGLVQPSADGTLTVNGSVTEGPSYP